MTSAPRSRAGPPEGLAVRPTEVGVKPPTNRPPCTPGSRPSRVHGSAEMSRSRDVRPTIGHPASEGPLGNDGVVPASGALCPPSAGAIVPPSCSFDALTSERATGPPRHRGRG